MTTAWEERLAPSDVARVNERLKAYGRMSMKEKADEANAAMLWDDLCRLGLDAEEAEDLVEELCSANGTASAFWPGEREDETSRF